MLMVKLKSMLCQVQGTMLNCYAVRGTDLIQSTISFSLRVSDLYAIDDFIIKMLLS